MDEWEPRVLRRGMSRKSDDAGNLVISTSAAFVSSASDGTQVTTQTGRYHEDGEHMRAPRDERTHEAREQHREERRDADEKEDEDRD